jgi:hypothetical protein
LRGLESIYHGIHDLPTDSILWHDVTNWLLIQNIREAAEYIDTHADLVNCFRTNGTLFMRVWMTQIFADSHSRTKLRAIKYQLFFLLSKEREISGRNPLEWSPFLCSSCRFRARRAILQTFPDDCDCYGRAQLNIVNSLYRALSVGEFVGWWLKVDIASQWVALAVIFVTHPGGRKLLCTHDLTHSGVWIWPNGSENVSVRVCFMVWKQWLRMFQVRDWLID